MNSYKIVRFYADNREREVKSTGLTLQEAQEHCNDPETSSRTTTTDGDPGDWFDGYTEE
jgi:hypothetical protein